MTSRERMRAILNNQRSGSQEACVGTAALGSEAPQRIIRGLYTGERTREDAMTEPASSKPNKPHRLVIRNIGLLLSGDLDQPILDADSVVAVDGRIVALGKERAVDTTNATLVIDAHGVAL